MVKPIYANTWEGLTVKMLGYYHDHCHHKYIGACDSLPSEFKIFNKKTAKYVFLYEEDTPTIKIKKDEQTNL